MGFQTGLCCRIIFTYPSLTTHPVTVDGFQRALP